MKFVLVMIICFGTDCEAVYDKLTTFNSYNECYNTAVQSATYMKEMFPQTSGEIHCWNQDQMAIFEEWLEDGNEPTIDPSLLPKENGIST